MPNSISQIGRSVFGDPSSGKVYCKVNDYDNWKELIFVHGTHLDFVFYEKPDEQDSNE